MIRFLSASHPRSSASNFFNRFSRLLLLLFLLLFWTASSPAPASAAAWQKQVDPWVLQTASQGQTEFLVLLSEQADLSAARLLPTRQAKGRYVYDALRKLADRSQAPLLQALQALGVEYRPYWIANLVWVRGDLSVVETLAQRSDVFHIYANSIVQLSEPAVQPAVSAPLTPQGVEWNLLQVQADQVWALGYTGQGVVVAGADTGYAWTHPALKSKYRGWNGLQVDHNYNWHDAIHTGSGTCGADSSEPCDVYGHGTHTMGIMVGSDGSNQIGMAPDAKWIGCRNMDNNGYGSPARYIECFQWFMAPTDLNGLNPDPSKAPDVINNSWACTSGEGCDKAFLLADILLPVVNNVRAAGILTVQSAGNSGTGNPSTTCGTVNTPAAIYASSFTVGSTTYNDYLSYFSSRGPVTIDGSGRMKPEVSAPGEVIRSSIPPNSYGSKYGTSMAAPHVAGLVALLISANPALSGQVDELEWIIEHSAAPVIVNPAETCGGISSSQVPNNSFGWGRIDALAALQQVHRLVIGTNVQPAEVAPGSQITYTFTITHFHAISPTYNLVFTDTLPLSTTLVSATPGYTQAGRTLTWSLPSLAAGQHLQVELVVQVDPRAGKSITNQYYGASSDEALRKGKPLLTAVIQKLYFPFWFSSYP